MKGFSFIVISALLLSFAFTLNFQAVKNKNDHHHKSDKENIMQPNERMLLQRSYPDAEFDYKAYHKALNTEYQHIYSASYRGPSLSWYVEGPGNIGGRFNCVVADPNNSNIIYAGAASGGIFKTTDGGNAWNPIFDDKPFLAIGCLTIDPNNSNIIWAGTGDANISGLCYIGDGIYKSIDAGATWTNMGLNNQHVFSKIIVDPTNSNIIYAATMGQPFVRDNNRGLYKSTNGGISWNPILTISNQAGIIDLVMDATNPQVLYAASYDRIRNNQESITYGKDSKIWKTIDGGSTWTHLTNGLPNFAVSRIGLAIASSNSNVIYAVIADSTNYFQGVYKSIDAGTTWTDINISSLDPNAYSGFGWYFGKIAVNPANENQIYVLGVDSYTTSDDGNTWSLATPTWQLYQVHGDHHDLFFIDANTALLCTDGGIYKTIDNCVSWTDVENIPANQVYHSIENPHVADEYWCGMQDNGTANGNMATINSWNRVYGGDGFQAAFDASNSNIFYAEAQNGWLTYTDDGGQNFYDATQGIDWMNDVVNWDMPYIISKHNNTTMYCGTNKVYQMTGAPYGTWMPISPDLTDGLGQYRDDLHTITSISESALSSGIIYASTADANVWVTTNTGSTWTNVTRTLPNRYVTSVKASPNVASNVYTTHSGYRDGDNIPHIHKSINYGSSWINISGDLPQVAVNDIIIKEGNENILFAATDIGVYYTVNAGINWIRLGNNMPLIPVNEIEFNKTKNKIIASTFGRSVQTIDISSVSLGIDDNYLNDLITVYPNPATDFIKVKLPSITDVAYTIYSLKGDIVKKEELNNKVDVEVQISELPKGTYLIEMLFNKQRVTKHFIKM